MKKTIYLLLFIGVIFLILINSYDIMENIRFSFSLCINNLFPSLIPFMLLSNILIKYNFVNDLSNILSKLMTKVFKVNKNCSFVLIMSILSGSPSNAVYLKNLLDNNLITTDDVQKCLNFCHFTNPIFILGTIGYSFLGNKKIGLIILICHYFSNLIIGNFNNKKSKNNEVTKDLTIGNKNFIFVLKNSIIDTIDTLFLILGIVTTSIIITTLLNCVFKFNDNYKFIYGLIEITQGLKYLSVSNLDIELKAIIASSIISFGGICIHAQVFSIIDNKKIKYLPYLLSRIIHSILSACLTFIAIEMFL